MLGMIFNSCSLSIVDPVAVLCAFIVVNPLATNVSTTQFYSIFQCQGLNLLLQSLVALTLIVNASGLS